MWRHVTADLHVSNWNLCGGFYFFGNNGNWQATRVTCVAYKRGFHQNQDPIL